jgi:hypothetical protein
MGWSGIYTVDCGADDINDKPVIVLAFPFKQMTEKKYQQIMEELIRG